MELTAATRPRMASGVSICTSICRTKTLIMSAAPSSASRNNDHQKLVDTPNNTVAMPKTSTPANIIGPTRRLIGLAVSQSAVSEAPIPGLARSQPSPCGPTCSTSLA